MAATIAKDGGGGVVLVYNKVTNRYEGTDPKTGQPLVPIPGKPLVLVNDWVAESDLGDSGFSEAAADAFFAAMIRLNQQPGVDGRLFNSPMHFIGHSRGTSVNSEIIQRFDTYFPAVKIAQETTLDPHDFAQNGGASGPAFVLSSWNDFNDPQVQVWNNVVFADNYYQTTATKNVLGMYTATPNGRNIPGADLNLDLSFLQGRSGFQFDDAAIGFDDFFALLAAGDNAPVDLNGGLQKALLGLLNGGVRLRRPAQPRLGVVRRHRRPVGRELPQR